MFVNTDNKPFKITWVDATGFIHYDTVEEVDYSAAKLAVMLKPAFLSMYYN